MIQGRGTKLVSGDGIMGSLPFDVDIFLVVAKCIVFDHQILGVDGADAPYVTLDYIIGNRIMVRKLIGIRINATTFPQLDSIGTLADMVINERVPVSPVDGYARL